MGLGGASSEYDWQRLVGARQLLCAGDGAIEFIHQCLNQLVVIDLQRLGDLVLAGTGQIQVILLDCLDPGRRLMHDLPHRRIDEVAALGDAERE
jgi:hypothetical protein